VLGEGRVARRKSHSGKGIQRIFQHGDFPEGSRWRDWSRPQSQSLQSSMACLLCRRILIVDVVK